MRRPALGFDFTARMPLVAPDDGVFILQPDGMMAPFGSLRPKDRKIRVARVGAPYEKG